MPDRTTAVAVRPRRRLAPSIVFAALLLAFSSTDSAAGTITFTSFDQNVASATFGTIPGHGLAAGASVPGFSWNYTGIYSDPRLPAFHASFTDHICIGPSGDCDSNNNDGVTGNEYAGYEFYYYSFVLPSDATNIRLVFDDFDADDRAVLGINGTWIGGFKSSAAVGGTTITTMKNGSGNQTVTFQKTPVPVQNNQALFTAGTTNYFTMWVNNTNSTSLGASALAHITGDYSVIRLRGGILYDQATPGAPVPEPATLTLLGVGLAGLSARRLKARRARR